MKKDRNKRNNEMLNHLYKLYNFIADNAQCSDSEFFRFMEELANKIMKGDPDSSGYGPELYHLWTGFGIGFVYGNMVTINRSHKKVVEAINKIRDEMADARLFPGLSMK